MVLNDPLLLPLASEVDPCPSLTSEKFLRQTTGSSFALAREGRKADNRHYMTGKNLLVEYKSGHIDWVQDHQADFNPCIISSCFGRFDAFFSIAQSFVVGGVKLFQDLSLDEAPHHDALLDWTARQ